MKIVRAGGITSPKGFKANGLCCGIKSTGKLDLGLIASDCLAVSASVFTKNSVKAAPLLVSQKHARHNKILAIVANSGNANCFTGKFGMIYAERTAQIIGKLLKIPKENVIVASTGIIGKPLPFKKIEAAAPELVRGLSVNGGKNMAKSILTTDLGTKEKAVSITIGGKKVTIAGCAKGSGMIAPNMATMLGFITTDAAITAAMLKNAFKTAIDQSFNCITIDGCMSTNDMVTVLANGRAQNKTISKKGKNFDAFAKALAYVCLDLAKKIVIDGEGATKFIEIHCVGARNYAQAKKVGLAIANSNLVKTAASGSNPNWGRVAAAAGSLGMAPITEKNLKIKFSPFYKKEIQISVDLNLGTAQATIYTSDLSVEYININKRYS
ncbi:MAG TPA: bifunctional glutamate N-acetyltransferase/amino-acid acetyltransferase ArgJ [Candidatus Omnitrophota bacterium]|nr:bifunctional glutamate N-acetyltransferase/amino-acid acetyltransferase ArgJ [Candidatus Omnitrophota bacterium]